METWWIHKSKQGDSSVSDKENFNYHLCWGRSSEYLHRLKPLIDLFKPVSFYYSQSSYRCLLKISKLLSGATCMFYLLIYLPIKTAPILEPLYQKKYLQFSFSSMALNIEKNSYLIMIVKAIIVKMRIALAYKIRQLTIESILTSHWFDSWKPGIYFIF